MLNERDQAVLLITGIQAAGKSTIAQGVAEQLPRSVHLRGDAFRRMVVGGREEMSAPPSEEALRQLRLRHRLTAQAADGYFAAGFTVVAQDVILGEHLAEMVESVSSRPLLVVVLAPSPEAIAKREAGRGKTAYDSWAIAELNAVLHEQTPRIGLWLDTSEQTPEQTVAEILGRAWTEAAI
ncbi:AAA family ATPase [Saccharopolyspora sp. NPDC050389]|uniref:AAA family ATPase n=1 Tax=Saccharopolyspora sp. NPDC050389 TaxID=3155516 RepID=UPI0033C3CCBE